MKIYKTLLSFLVAGLLFSCQNEEATFPDFEYSTVYFASQYPLRTLELGDETEVDNSLDNMHKVKIKATLGGVYSNSLDRTIDFKVDETLCNGVLFSDGSTIVPMPANYYKFASNQIVIPAGNILGGVEVELTDDFFNDPNSIKPYYVIPLLMTGVADADSILSGKATVSNPRRLVSADWSVVPKDYVLYAIKYVNPWHANYLRRGTDLISDGVSTVTDIRHKEYVEYDEVVSTKTVSYKQCSLPITIYKDDNLTTRAKVELLLTFDENNNCTISNPSTASTYTITGSGKFVTKGEKKSMGGKDRNALYLDYTVNLTNLGYTYVTKDTLVCRNRGVIPEYYTIK